MQSSTTLGYAVATQDSIVLTRDRHWFLIGLIGPWNWMIYLFNMDISMHFPSSIQEAAARISGFSPNISGVLLPEKWSGAGCMSRVNIGFVVLLVHLSISRRSLKQARSMPEMGLEKARNVCRLEMGRVEHPQAQHLLRWWVIWVHSNSDFLPSLAPIKNGSSLMWTPSQWWEWPVAMRQAISPWGWIRAMAFHTLKRHSADSKAIRCYFFRIHFGIPASPPMTRSMKHVGTFSATWESVVGSFYLGALCSSRWFPISIPIVLRRGLRVWAMSAQSTTSSPTSSTGP